MLKEDKLDAVVCVAGGWAGGNAASPGIMHTLLLSSPWVPGNADLVKNCDLMWKQSVWSSVLAGQIAARHLNRCVEYVSGTVGSSLLIP